MRRNVHIAKEWLESSSNRNRLRRIFGITGEHMHTISMDRKKLKKLCVEYNLAVMQNKDSFIFEGIETLTKYAKYMIDYAQGVLNADTNHTKRSRG